MDIKITERAAKFYINEMNLTESDDVSLFVRVGGVGSGGFSVGIHKGKPDKEFLTYEVSSISFCLALDDLWYLDGITIDFDEDIGDIIFRNERFSDLSNP
ncbi:hypothetical protein CR203_04045 [Salipaludibacillus neizhouensis]|uniref:Core domain-containing protein n=1 Tax=Salipaludibacillus neizhouensis TaxID=885475 RepID=A0A3A9KEY6_9BACI|nr:iron-sulfur cluster biosynthesis family protein [Salipaludibacillus neizhouensis]RKL69210.1 hypothetical protein CR203_04045 [Salipaludibacillus neizhouensis]